MGHVPMGLEVAGSISPLVDMKFDREDVTLGQGWDVDLPSSGRDNGVGGTTLD